MKTLFTLLTAAITTFSFAQSPLTIDSVKWDVLNGSRSFTHNEYVQTTSNNIYLDIKEREFHKMNVFPFHQTAKVSFGYSSQMIRQNNALLHPYQEGKYSTTSTWLQPQFRLTHELYLGRLFSLAYSVGGGSNQTFVGEEQLSRFNLMAFAHPKLNYFRTKHVEGYIKLNVGMVYNDMNKELIDSESLRSQLSPNLKLYTGFTPIGLNVRLTEQLWMNSELSLWSFETFSVGLKYKFKKNIYRLNMHEEAQSIY